MWKEWSISMKIFTRRHKNWTFYKSKDGFRHLIWKGEDHICTLKEGEAYFTHDGEEYLIKL